MSEVVLGIFRRRRVHWRVAVPSIEDLPMSDRPPVELAREGWTALEAWLLQRQIETNEPRYQDAATLLRQQREALLATHADGGEDGAPAGAAMLAEANALLDAIQSAVNGDEPSDFMLSFTIVRSVWDLYIQRHSDGGAQLERDVKLFQHGGHAQIRECTQCRQPYPDFSVSSNMRCWNCRRLAADGVATSEWRAIESAPKDGRSFLCWDGSRMFVIEWDSAQMAWFDWLDNFERKPLLWRPLPPAPSGATPQGEKE